MTQHSDEKAQTSCGADFEHDWHLFTTQRGKVLACDGTFRAVKEASR